MAADSVSLTPCRRLHFLPRGRGRNGGRLHPSAQQTRFSAEPGLKSVFKTAIEKGFAILPENGLQAATK